MAEPRELPKVKLNGKVYFADDHLQELRNVADGNDRIGYEDVYDMADLVEDCVDASEIGQFQSEIAQIENVIKYAF